MGPRPPMGPRPKDGMGRRMAKPEQRLPKLDLHNVNKRAQRIIAEQMDSVRIPPGIRAEDETKKTSVLARLEQSAPKTARANDVSHRSDTKSHIVTPAIPKTLIDEADHIYEVGLLPKDSRSVFNERDGMWHTKVFPSDTPHSRADAILLDHWITGALARFGENMDCVGKDSKQRNMEQMVPLLNTAMHEMIRQITYHCPKRAVTLDKLWRTYIELFHRVLRQLRNRQDEDTSKTRAMQSTLAETRMELGELRKSHPARVHALIAELEQSFSQRQDFFEKQLAEKEADNEELKAELRRHAQELNIWWPNLPSFINSPLKNHLPAALQTNARTRNFADEEIPLEVALSDDLKRLLTALKPEKRKSIGQDLKKIFSEAIEEASTSSRAGSKNYRPAKGATESTTKSSGRGGGPGSQEELEALRQEVGEQEAQIRLIRERILEVEAQIAERSEAPDKLKFVHFRGTGPNVDKPEEVMAKQNRRFSEELALKVLIAPKDMLEMEVKRQTTVANLSRNFEDLVAHDDSDEEDDTDDDDDDDDDD